jgi:hypothetical protein
MSCPDNSSNVFSVALEAWGRIGDRVQHSFADWILVGTALAAIQTDAMVAADTNQPLGRRYCKEFGGLLREAGLADLAGIDKGCRSRLLKVLEHRDEIQIWMEALPRARRAKLNHPNTVWAAWSKAMGLGTTKPKLEPKPELCTIWKNASTEEWRAALDDGGDELLVERFSSEMLTKMTKRLRPAKANAEVLGERICKEVDEIRALAKHYETNRNEINRKLTAIKSATRGIGKAPATTPMQVDLAEKALKGMGNGAGDTSPPL